MATNRFSLLVFLLLVPVCLSMGQQPVWQFHTYSAIYGGVAVDKGSLYFGNEGGELYALNAKGQKQWMVNLEGAIKSKPALDGKTLYINTDKGLLYAIHKKTGKTLWKKQVGGEAKYDLWDYYLSSPLVHNQRIFLGLGDGHILSLSSTDGSEVWRFKTEGPVHASPVVHDQLLLVGSFDGKLYALAHDNGQLAWSFDTEGTQSYPKGEIQKAITISGNTGYITCRGNFLYALNLADGKEIASYFEPGSWIIASPTITNGRVFFGTSDSQAFRALNQSDLKPVWSVGSTMRIYGKALQHNDQLYYGTFDGRVHSVGLNGEAGKLSFQSHNGQQNHALIYNEKGTFRNDILTLYGSNMPAAEMLLTQLGPFAADMTVLNNILLAPDAAGTLYAFQLD